MNDLATTTSNLPITIEDLSTFVLVGREKVKAVRAEIAAIEKLGLAEEVRNQKREECTLISEALLDAEARLGTLLKQIPKAQGTRSDLCDENEHVRSGADKLSKKEVIKNLGFSQDQAERFETLADNPDIIEEVKQEARDNDDIPTRSRVLELVKQRKRESPQNMDAATYGAYLDNCKKNFNEYVKAVYGVLSLRVDGNLINALSEGLCGDAVTYDKYLDEIGRAIDNLQDLRNKILGCKNKQRRY